MSKKRTKAIKEHFSITSFSVVYMNKLVVLRRGSAAALPLLSAHRRSLNCVDRPAAHTGSSGVFRNLQTQRYSNRSASASVGSLFFTPKNFIDQQYQMSCIILYSELSRKTKRKILVFLFICVFVFLPL